jgi:two-component system, NtrC family, sensor kinase
MKFLHEDQQPHFREYLVILVIAVAGTLLVSGLVEGYVAYREHRVALARLQRESARSTATTVQSYFDQVVRQIRWTNPLPLPGTAVTLEMRRDEFLRALRQMPEVHALTYLDASGRAVLSPSGLFDYGIPVAYEVAFREAKALDVYYGPYRFESSWIVAVADPRRDGGVTVGEVGLKFLWDVVSRVGLGQGGLAYIVDSDGRLVAHPEVGLVLRGTDFSSLPQVQAMLAAPPRRSQEDDGVILGRDFQGRAVLTTAVALDPPGWLLFVEQPHEEALAPVYGTMLRTACLLVVGVGAAIVVSLVLARRRATIPPQVLVQATEVIQ